jgi:hypothetical protein
VKKNKKHPLFVILNAVKNPAYSMDKSCSKADKSFTAQTFTPTVGFFLAQKLVQNDKKGELLVQNDKKLPGMSF